MERVLSIALKTLPLNAPVSGVNEHSKAHMQQRVLGRVLMSVDCTRAFLYTLTTQHPSGPQYARTAHQPTALNGTIPEEQVWGFESATFTKDMLARA